MARKINVTMGDNGYNMGIDEYNKLLIVTKEFIGSNTIYAIEKDNLAIMLNDVYLASNDLHDAVNGYMKDGFKVYFTIENEVKN